MVDEFYIALEANEEKEGLIMNERFIMGIFQGIMDELPPFEKTGPKSSKISLCLLLVSVRVSF